MQKSTARKLHKTIVYALLILMSIFCLIPYFWAVVTSLKTEENIFTAVPQFVPHPLTFTHYIVLWGTHDFLRVAFNSVIVATGTTAMCILIGTFAGYALARLKFPGSHKMLIVILCTQLVPGALIIVPLYLIIARLGLLDTHFALIFTYLSFSLAFSTYMLRGYFRTIPEHLEDAAMIDGCSRLSAVFKVIIPLSAPGVAAVAIYTFILVWDEFMFANIMTDTTFARTLPVVLNMQIGEYATQWGLLMASSVVLATPVVILFIFLQRWFVQGLTAGAIKG